MNSIAPTKKFLRPDQIEQIYSIPVLTLQTLRYRRQGPVYIKRGRSVLYPVGEFEAWLEQGRREPISRKAQAGSSVTSPIG